MQVYGKPLVYLDNGASAQKPQVGASTRIPARLLPRNMPTFIAACTSCRMPPPMPMKRPVRRCASFLNAPSTVQQVDLHTVQRHRGDQYALRPHLAMACPTSARATRSCCRSWSTIPTSCPGISIRERQRRQARLGTDVDDLGRLSHRGVREARWTRPNQSWWPSRTCRMRWALITAHQGDRADCPCARHSGARRWQPGRRPYAEVDVRDLDCRLLCFHRPQDLWPVRHRRPLWQGANISSGMPPYSGGGEMIEDGHGRQASPTTSRRTASRPVRRRSSRQLGSARHWIIWKAIGRERDRST